jgi:hypothetical protein
MAEEHPEGGAERLALQALLYAGGALDEPEVDDFEARLAADQRAREALCRAVELVQSCAGGPVRPDPAYRERVRRRVAPRGLLGLLLRRRLYSGHPAAWAGLGAVAAALVMLVLFGGPLPPVPAAGQPLQVAEGATPPPAAVSEPAHAETAKILAKLPRSEHLLKAYTEEAQRKARAETLQRLVKTDTGRTRLLSTSKN